MEARLAPPRLPLPTRRPVALALALVLPGCTGSEAPASPDVPRMTLGTPELRWGSLDDPASSLVAVDAAVLGPDGRLWVAQGQDGQVLAVGPDGEAVLRIGGSGEGPGEFAAVGPLGWLGDTLWVADRRNRRVTRFSRDGALLGDSPLPTADVDEERVAGFTGLLREGALFVEGPSGPALLEDPSPGAPDPILRTGPNGGPGRIVALRRGAPERVVVAETSGGEIRGIFIYDQAWSDGTIVEPAPDGSGFVTVDRRVGPDVGQAFRLTRFDARGDTVWTTVRPYDPVPVDPGRRDSLLLAWSRTGPSEESLRAVLFLPVTEPPASSAFVGLDGQVWVGRERLPGADTRRWDVFASDGTPAAEVTAPANVDLVAADGRDVWGIETDAFDVPYVVRYAWAPG